jgi:formylmethanofuran dehydrogenase subunit C
MSAMRLTLREQPPERLDLTVINPASLAGLGEREIAELDVGTSRTGIRLGDCFTITAGTLDEIRIEGGSSRLDNLGLGLAEGTIRLEGDAGQRLGFGMSGGEIHVSGSVGPYVGSGATGGLMTIGGDADDHAGGAVHGAKGGLCGGTIVIRGRAGARAGDRMRSGLIIAEQTGPYAGSRMFAGTIVAGTVGDYPGYAMRRGTLLVREHGHPVPSFVETGVHRLVFVRILERTVRPCAPHLAELAREDLHRRAGDLATLGKGELLTPHR